MGQTAGHGRYWVRIPLLLGVQHCCWMLVRLVLLLDAAQQSALMRITPGYLHGMWVSRSPVTAVVVAQMLETPNRDGMPSTLLDMDVWATTTAVTGDLDTHMPCKYPGVVDTCDYRSELI